MILENMSVSQPDWSGKAPLRKVLTELGVERDKIQGRVMKKVSDLGRSLKREEIMCEGPEA